MATPQMTKRFPRAESLTRAQELIERDDPLIYDVAASLGQQVANIRHMKSFVRLVAEWLEEKQRCASAAVLSASELTALERMTVTAALCWLAENDACPDIGPEPTPLVAVDEVLEIAKVPKSDVNFLAVVKEVNRQRKAIGRY